MRENMYKYIYQLPETMDESYVPVPPAIIPTYFTVLITGSAFFSGRIANVPGKRTWKTLKHTGSQCL